jgi:hypothetical protein
MPAPSHHHHRHHHDDDGSSPPTPASPYGAARTKPRASAEQLNVSLQHVRRHVAKKRLPDLKVGKFARFD